MQNVTLIIGAVLTYWSVISMPATTATAYSLEFNGWRSFSPREEIRPDFLINQVGGSDGQGGLVIKHDDRKGLDGAWTKTFEIEGGCHYRITAYSQINNVSNPRHHIYMWSCCFTMQTVASFSIGAPAYNPGRSIPLTWRRI